MIKSIQYKKGSIKLINNSQKYNKKTMFYGYILKGGMKIINNIQSVRCHIISETPMVFFFLFF